MAQDYHIYIHSDSQNGDSKTKPFSSEKESAFKPSSSQNDIGEDSVAETGASSLSKVAPWIATAIAVGKVVDSVLTIGFSHLTEYTGHYEYEMSYNNWKTLFHHVMNPIGYAKQVLHRDFQFRKENQRIEQEAKLIGKTIYSDWKIGV